jgi:heme O synthase-like polyprenyltransferase
VLLRNRNPRAPIETFRYSILYLALLFAVLLVDHYWITTPSPALLHLERV